MTNGEYIKCLDDNEKKGDFMVGSDDTKPMEFEKDLPCDRLWSPQVYQILLFGLLDWQHTIETPVLELELQILYANNIFLGIELESEEVWINNYIATKIPQ